VGYAKRKVISHAPELEITTHSSSVGAFFWFVAKGNLLKGPYSTQELRNLIQSSEIPSKYFVWRDGFKEWRPIYGIHELVSDSVKEPEQLIYPLLPTPGSKSGSESKPVLDKAPMYKVRFSTSRFAQLDKREIFGAFLFTLLFSLVLIFYSFHSFEEQWHRFWGKKISGSLLQMGHQKEVLPLALIQPLLSAPGLKYQEEHWISVEIEEGVAHNPAYIHQLKIHSPLPLEDHIESLSWDKTHTYARQVRVEGLLNLKDPGKIFVEHLGLPYESILSERRVYKLSK
jgi:hypothetical protein